MTAPGVCSTCFTRPSLPRRLTCEDCMARARRYRETFLQRHPIAAVCHLCRKNAPKPGRKTCEDCLRALRTYRTDVRTGRRIPMPRPGSVEDVPAKAMAPEPLCSRCGLHGHDSAECDLRVERFARTNGNLAQQTGRW